MRSPRSTLLAPFVLAMGLALAPACRDATQVTLEISLAARAACAETNGTAITVGGARDVTEQRVRDGIVTTTTSSCNDATREIGTLVVTPGDAGRASIVVVVSYDKTVLPSSCTPPLFKGCIVARRQFSFTDHKGLRMPITIDPSCKDVPCDALSTCRTGTCFPAETTCTGDACIEPGDPGDGGTAEAGTNAALDASDASGDDAADASGTSDGGDGGTPGTNVTCNKGQLFCATSLCSGAGKVCCETVGMIPECLSAVTCAASKVQHCCDPADCPTGAICVGATTKVPGVCRPNVMCNTNVLVCPPTLGADPQVCAPGSATACCTTPNGTFCTGQPTCAIGEPRYCCTDADCGVQGTCNGPVGGSVPRTCLIPANQ